MKVTVMSDTNSTPFGIPIKFDLYKGATSFDRLTKDYSTDMIRLEKKVESLTEENKKLTDANIRISIAFTDTVRELKGLHLPYVVRRSYAENENKELKEELKKLKQEISSLCAL